MNPAVQPAPPSLLPRLFLFLVGLHIAGGCAAFIWFSAPRAPADGPAPAWTPNSSAWFSPGDFIGDESDGAAATVQAVIRHIPLPAAPNPAGLEAAPFPLPEPAREAARMRAAGEIDNGLADMIEKLWRAPASIIPPAKPGLLHIVVGPAGAGISCSVEEPTGHVEFDHALAALAGDMSVRLLPLPENWPGGAYEALAEVAPR